MAQDDGNEKTSIITGETFGGKMRAADQTPPALVVLMGPTSYIGKQFALDQSEFIIGRSGESPIQIDDRSVSRNHARILVVGNDVTISDLGSANKTVVGSTTLTPGAPFKLRNNDQIKIGNVILKFLERGNIESVATKELHEKATRDSLTGAFSKGSLLERGPELVKRSETLGEELSLIVFDLDHFKKINDQYGHSAGDFVLKKVCQIIMTKLVRSEDFFARYGGEEFVILLIKSPLQSSIEIAERIRSTIENADFTFEGKQVPVRVSAGVATRLPQETEWENFFARADAALYLSKQGGRNRVTVASGNFY